MKFSIRDVLWLTVVVAMGVCWGIDRTRIQLAADRASMQSRRERLAERRARWSEQSVRAALEQELKAAQAARDHAELKAAEQRNESP